MLVKQRHRCVDSGRKANARAYDAMIAAVALANGYPSTRAIPDDFARIDGLGAVAAAHPGRALTAGQPRASLVSRLSVVAASNSPGTDRAEQAECRAKHEMWIGAGDWSRTRDIQLGRPGPICGVAPLVEGRAFRVQLSCRRLGRRLT